MVTIDIEGLIADLRAVRQIVDRLESKLGGLVSEGVDPYERRREVLQRIYWHQQKDTMTRRELLPILENYRTDYRWIAQQVKKGYLIILPVPNGEPRYAVTAKAVQELSLSPGESLEELGEIDALAKLSEASFAEDWNSPEDAIYDSI